MNFIVSPNLESICPSQYHHPMAKLFLNQRNHLQVLNGLQKKFDITMIRSSHHTCTSLDEAASRFPIYHKLYNLEAYNDLCNKCLGQDMMQFSFIALEQNGDRRLNFSTAHVDNKRSIFQCAFGTLEYDS